MTKIQRILMFCCDWVFSFISFPKHSQRNEAKIVAHRGWHNGQDVLENTLKAFRLAVENGLWGIEFDIRWTKDLVPIVHHDESLERIWKRPLKISETSFNDLRQEVPEIPTLEEVVEEFGGKIHFFIELKWEYYPSAQEQNSILLFILKNLSPGVDFHFLSLNPKVFEVFATLPNKYKFLVAMTNTKEMSEIALAQDFAGIMGHYLLVGPSIVSEHLRASQKLGTGYPRTKNLVDRELNRGIEYLFTNHPWELK